jgi:hypothetical protein
VQPLYPELATENLTSSWRANGSANARPMTGCAKQSIVSVCGAWIASSLRSSQ